MAKDKDEVRPPKRKREISDWANKDLIPLRPSPGQVLRQRRKKD